MTESLETDTLRFLLRTLMQKIAAEAKMWRDSGRLVIAKQKYILRPDFSLLYTVDPTMLNFPIQEIEEEVWDGDNFDMFVNERIRPLSGYGAIVEIAKASSRADRILELFAWRVAQDVVLGKDQPADRYLEAIVRDVSGGETEYSVCIWLNGVTLSRDDLRISERLTLRRATREDVHEKVPAHAVSYAHIGHWSTSFSCIAEFRVRARGPADMQREVDRLVTSLRLFRLGSVSSGRYEFLTESFSPFGSGRLGGLALAARTTYALSPDDVPSLQRFLEVLPPVLPSPYELPQQKPDFLSTALRWYGEAMLAMAPIEGAIAWAIACLEALFLGDNPPSELLYRLIARTVSLLRCFGWSPLEIRKVIKTAYDIRSRYVHGAIPKKLPREELTKLFQEVADYARVSCLVWVQLFAVHGHRREDILKGLENALIDDNAGAQLERWCNRVDFARRP